ncbi:MAG: methyltransferase domain-containing protein [Alphaproteobacteria bacterium]|nr:methyltransferase domain-containing protein [Alphaproteobacteria bacterium]
MSEITPEQQLARMWEHIRGFHVVHHVSIGTKLALFDELKGAPGGLTAAQLAAVLDLHEPYIDNWCKTGYAYEILDAGAGGTYCLAPHMDQILASRGNPRYLAPYFMGATDHFGPDLDLYPEFFRTGQTYTFQEHGEAFSKAIADITSGLHVVVARHLLPAIPGLKDRLEAGVSVLDMGCGAGGLLIQIAQTYPKAACTGVDVDVHGISIARDNISHTGLEDRIAVEHLDGDAIAHENEFDVVILFEVLHEVPVSVRASILANCHRAMKNDGVLFILDETYPSTPEDLRNPEYAFAVQTGFNELIWGNVVPTREEQDTLLRDAGFAGVERSVIGDIFTMITARKA